PAPKWLGHTAAPPDSAFLAPTTLGLGTRTQLVPFQCTMQVWLFAITPCEPTAHTLSAEMAATPFRVAVRIGAATTPQVAPAQCSISGWPLVTPTAQASLSAIEVTP